VFKIKKRGQITIFIIVGLVILITFILVYYLTSLTSKRTKADFSAKIEKEKNELKAHVESCIRDVSLPLIEGISKHGGTFLPNTSIFWEGYELNSFCKYKTNFGYLNNLVLRQDIENELSFFIKKGIKSCVNLDIFRERGFNVSEGEIKVETTIGLEDIAIKLNFPITLTKQGHKISLNEFSDKVFLPLGRLYAIAVDITNDEISNGFFDKEEFMLEHGNVTIVEKHRIYPHTIYILKQFVKKKSYNKYFIFQFAIEGKDTVGKEVLKYDNRYGCCTNTRDNFCFKNTNPTKCGNNTYSSSVDCVCKKNIEREVEGCCVVNNRCLFTTKEICLRLSNSIFYENDLRCSKANCTYLNCNSTYNYVNDDFSNPPRKHGESWCSYESIVGKGTDYVGTRHYLHSCLYGIEYVEECRDYREELCTEEVIKQSGKYYSKARCRINRWYDCAEQTNLADCENEELRDCYWFECNDDDPSRVCDNINSGYHGLWSQKKCHPQVAPGFKFWESDGEKICNLANLYKNSYGADYPKSWGFSTMLYCQRMGDCGNYRNFVDVVTDLGYYNPDESEISKSEIAWTYFSPGNIYRGDDFVINLDIDKTNLAQNVKILSGQKDGFARCSLWQAPNYGNCSKCQLASLRPCTEYKCKSLGKNCIFQIINHTPRCIDAGAVTIEPPEVELKSISNGFNYKKISSPYYQNTYEHIITPSLESYEPFNFSFATSIPTRCILSLTPPVSTVNIQDLPRISLNDYNFKKIYNVTIRFPSLSLFNLSNEIELFVNCINKNGIPNDVNFMLRFNINDSSAKPPKIIYIKPSPLRKGKTNKILIYTNKPIIECRVSSDITSFDNMQSFCDYNGLELLYVFGEPLGVFRCSKLMRVNYDRLYFQCRDLDNQMSNMFFVLAS